MDEKEPLSLDDEPFADDSDRTIIQGIRNLQFNVSGRTASLVVISGASAGKLFMLDYEKPMTIGRAHECEVCLPEEGISRTHARIDPDGHGNFAISDLASTNGTYFDGEPISRHILRDGDKIQVGSTTIVKFTYQDSVEQEFHKQQYEKAIRDGLTGAYNKIHFLAKLSEDFAYAVRHNEPLSLIMLDIDHFKIVNDTFGHPAGDMVLKRLAEVIGHGLREEDVFARYGGEEFAVVLRNQNEQRSYVAAERLRRQVETHKFLWQETRIPVTISLGIATLLQANFTGPDVMIQEADGYLYKAKRSGRNRTCSVLRS